MTPAKQIEQCNGRMSQLFCLNAHHLKYSFSWPALISQPINILWVFCLAVVAGVVAAVAPIVAVDVDVHCGAFINFG